MSFAAPWESTKSTPSRSSTTACTGSSPCATRARIALLERLGGREEETAVETHDDDARERLVVGVLGQVTEHVRAGLASEERHPGSGGHVDEPDERERDADHDAGKHAGREHAESAGGRDPEVEALHAVEAPQLGDVDHPEDDRVDDDRGEDGLRQLREERRERDQGQDHEPAGGEGRDRLRAPAASLSELADRLVETGIPWNTPEATLAIPCATDSWLTSMR